MIERENELKNNIIIDQHMKCQTKKEMIEYCLFVEEKNV
jgi:hypothetical protein